MTEPRLPTMKEMEEIVKVETMYKVAHVEDEKAGKFSSCFIGHPCRSGYYYHQQQLKYVVGKVTTAPSGSNGIWCYSSERLEFAQGHATGELDITIQPPCIVLEVKPLGEFYLQDKPMSVYVVGVYGKKEEYINPFKVGDRVKVKESVEKPKYGWDVVTHKDIGVVKEVHGDTLEVLFPTFCERRCNWTAHAPEMELVPEPTELDYLKEAQKTLGGDIKTFTKTGLHFCSDGRNYTLYHRQGIWALHERVKGLVATRDTLLEIVTFVAEDKPKEEWVDITEEITCKISANSITLSYKGEGIGVVGLLPFAHFASRYKVELTEEGFLPRIQLARILKKELK